MRLPKQAPFEEFKCYKIYHSKMDRWVVCLVRNNKDRTTITYAKYLKSIELGRILSREEEVDHVDGDKTNDDPSNLEVVTGEENRRRWSEAHPGRKVELQCPQCEKTFQRRKGQEQAVKSKGKSKDYCSRKCSREANPKVGRKLLPEEIPHGTKNCYSYHKCRCDLCKEANRTHQAEYQKKKSYSL